MRAIRARRLGHYELHWLADDAWTVCGRQLKHFEAVDDLDLAALVPHPEACETCDALRLSGARPTARTATFYRPARHGRLFKTGPTSHGPKSRDGGQWIPGP